MEEVEVSIVIINYNTFHLTMDCIQSIYSIATGLHYEIILVDNNSSDFDVLNFKTRFPQAKLIQSPTNVGFAKGTNLGISVANGEYILLLNSDTLLKNDVPKILHSFLVLHPRVAAVSGRLEYPDGKVQHNCQRFPSIKYQLFELLRLQKLLPKKWGGRILFGSFFDYESVAYPDWIWGTCFMFRKKLLDELPNSKLADDFFMYGEDVQWCMEFKKLCYQIAFEPLARITHHFGKSGAKRNDMIQKNTNWLLNKYYSKTERKIVRLLNWLLNAQS